MHEGDDGLEISIQHKMGRAAIPEKCEHALHRYTTTAQLTKAMYAAMSANMFHLRWWSVRHACSPSPHADPTRSAARRTRKSEKDAWYSHDARRRCRGRGGGCASGGAMARWCSAGGGVRRCRPGAPRRETGGMVARRAPGGRARPGRRLVELAVLYSDEMR
jgi:hypothetical protein